LLIPTLLWTWTVGLCRRIHSPATIPIAVTAQRKNKGKPEMKKQNEVKRRTLCVVAGTIGDAVAQIKGVVSITIDPLRGFVMKTADGVEIHTEVSNVLSITTG
jgi:hypothetical protein